MFEEWDAAVLCLYVGIVYGAHIIGPIYLACFDNVGAGFTFMRVIRRMYKICLLTTILLCAILRLDLAGAAPRNQQPARKAGWAGKPETACTPVVLWPTVWVPDAAAP